MRNKEIAAELRISEETAQGDVKNILAKFGVHDRTEAVAVAIHRGIFHLDESRCGPLKQVLRLDARGADLVN